MNRNLSNIEINILGRHYLVACEPEEEQNLHEAADHLNRLFAGMKQAAATADNEKVSVITALNLTDQLLKTRRMLREKVTHLIQLVETGGQSSATAGKKDSESLEITL